jgi:parallel beta-helix repeat protein
MRIGGVVFGLGTLVVSSLAFAKDVPVATAGELTAAIGAAQAGDRIVLADGSYALTANVSCSANGTAQAPIEVVAKNVLGAKITFAALEGFKVSGAYWHFEGLDVKGVCAVDSDCEHAFHVTGAAKGFWLRRSRVVDFNAQLKVNAAQIANVWTAPDDGLVEGNELFDTKARNTSNPTTKLNIDTGDRWIVRANYIHDYQKGGGDGVSYAAFMKSGGKSGVFERNLVVCSKSFTGGTRIGLSFGGGGTANQFCAPAYDANTPCDPEHTDGTLRNNVIASCSDVGIYLNEAKNTKVLFNTLVATAGIDFRFASSTGIAVGNVLDAKIRARDQGSFTGSQNLESVTTFAQMYQAPASGDLRKLGDLSILLGKGTARPDVPDDYCARARTGAWDLGALQASLGDCVTTTPTPGPDGGTPPSDAGLPPSGDAGGAPDGGPSPGDPAEGGCSCTTARAPTTPLAALSCLIPLALAARRRRR